MSERKKLYSLGCKVTAETKQIIDQRAAGSGRTQSQVVDEMIWSALKMDRWVNERLAKK
jgi:hypothetical protein